MVAKSTVSNFTSSPAKAEYPWLGISKEGAIVLFINNNCGTVIGHSVLVKSEQLSQWPLGHYSEIWYKPCFVEYAGTVTLENI